MLPVLYLSAMALVLCYSAHRLWLVWRYARAARQTAPTPPPPSVWPLVTVQLPLYNEQYVAERVIAAACALDYPRDRLEIQVLDDSSDATRQIAAHTVEARRRQGHHITYLHRRQRTHFKAGALTEALRRARGELIAVFDADFLPPEDFLRRTVPQFADRRVGMVQTRWGYLNAGATLLTRLQAILLDGHFVIEQTARSRSGYWFNFNGTAGIWRRQCIEDAGGWQHDTLTEDVDLSYRAQLRGWRFVYLPEVVCPSELPIEMAAFKSQQRRWAQGSVQTARKLLGRILRARWPWCMKVEACLQLTEYATSVPSLLLLLGLVPAMQGRWTLGPHRLWVFQALLLMVLSGTGIVFYLTAQRAMQGRWKTALPLAPLALALVVGLTVSNAKAVVEALLRRPLAFVRTPKYGASAANGAVVPHPYAAPRDWLAGFELALGMYLAYAVRYAWQHHDYGSVPLLAIFAAGCWYVGWQSLMPRAGGEWWAWLRRVCLWISSPIPSR